MILSLIQILLVTMTSHLGEFVPRG